MFTSMPWRLPHPNKYFENTNSYPCLKSHHSSHPYPEPRLEPHPCPYPYPKFYCSSCSTKGHQDRKAKKASQSNYLLFVPSLYYVIFCNLHQLMWPICWNSINLYPHVRFAIQWVCVFNNKYTSTSKDTSHALIQQVISKILSVKQTNKSTF